MNELASDGLLRLLVGEEGRTAAGIKKILTEYHKHSNTEAEKVIQSAITRGVVVETLNGKLFPSVKTNMFIEIANTRKRIERDQKKLSDELKELQEKCTHQGNLTYKYNGSSGNWDRNDSYWIEWHCKDCGKRWNTSQDNSYYQTEKQYPNSRRVQDGR